MKCYQQAATSLERGRREATLRVVASRVPVRTTFSNLIRNRCVDANITPIIGKIIWRNFGVEISAACWFA